MSDDTPSVNPVRVRGTTFPDRSTVRSVMLRTPPGRCVYCGVRLLPRDESCHPRQWTDDHVVPRSQGGGRALNIVPACRQCNLSKGGRTPEQWLVAMWRAVHDKAEYRWRVWRLSCPMATVAELP